MTTEGIYWFDERHPGKPVLGIKHYRYLDRTLEARSVLLQSGAEGDSQPVTFLTSRRTGLVSVYDVSRGKDDLVHMNAPSHCLSCITPHGGLPVTSWNLFQHPLMDPSHVDVLQLSSRGDINRLHAQLHLEDDVDPYAWDGAQGFIWTDEVQELANANLDLIGSDRLTARESSMVNLGPAYQGLPRRSYCLASCLLISPKTFSSPPPKRMRTQTLYMMLWTFSPLSGKTSMPRWIISSRCQFIESRDGSIP